MALGLFGKNCVTDMGTEEWLGRYYRRITEEYKISMERKDRALDWSITVFFLAIMAYSELLSSGTAAWRIYLFLIVELFLLRFFIGSILAYAYLNKWRHIIQQIDLHHFNNSVSIEDIQSTIDTYDHNHNTTKPSWYFIKNQLRVGFGLLFLFPGLIIVYEVSKVNASFEILIPILVTILIIVWEISTLPIKTKMLGKGD